jgi:hypothetical protein
VVVDVASEEAFEVDEAFVEIVGEGGGGGIGFAEIFWIGGLDGLEARLGFGDGGVQEGFEEAIQDGATDGGKGGLGMLPTDWVGGVPPEVEFGEIRFVDELGDEGVLEIVDVVGESVGEGGDLTFEEGEHGVVEEVVEVGQVGGFEVGAIELGGVEGEALAEFKGEVEATEFGVGMFEVFDDAEGLGVVFKTAVIFHGIGEGEFAGVAEWGMAEIVGEGDDFGKVGVGGEATAEPAGELGDFEGVGHAGAVVIAFVIDEDLCFVFEAAESGGGEDAMAIELEGIVGDGCGLGVAAGFEVFWADGVGGDFH